MDGAYPMAGNQRKATRTPEETMQSWNLFTRLAAMLMLSAFCGGAGRGRPAGAADHDHRAVSAGRGYRRDGPLVCAAHRGGPWPACGGGEQIGAGGTIGTQQVARARNDGYTLLWVRWPRTALGRISTRNSYDAVADFGAGGACSRPALFTGGASVQEYLVGGRAAQAGAGAPGQIPVASAGVGTAADMLLRKFQADTGLSLLGVPYKGAGPAMADLLGARWTWLSM